MVVINGVVLAIAPSDDRVVQFMREVDPSHVELLYYGTMVEGRGEGRRETTQLWGMSLETAEMVFGGEARWVYLD